MFLDGHFEVSKEFSETWKFRGAQRDRRAVAIREGCRRPKPVTRDVSTFPEFRKRGSHPDELRWDGFSKDAETADGTAILVSALNGIRPADRTKSATDLPSALCTISSSTAACSRYQTPCRSSCPKLQTAPAGFRSGSLRITAKPLESRSGPPIIPMKTGFPVMCARCFRALVGTKPG